MSNARAVAAVSATLANVLATVGSAAWPGSLVHVGRPERRPDAALDPPGINLFLYQARVDASLRNADLPSRTSEGRVIQRPTVGLALSYLLTFHGPGFVPELLLGQTVSTLHARPILTADLIRNAIAQKGAVPGDRDLKESDVDPVLAIHLAPQSLNLEQLSRLWSVFFQMPYVLSMVYDAEVVVVQTDEVPRPALPVAGFHASATAAGIPQIDQVLPQLAEASVDSQVILRGQNLTAGGLVVKFGQLTQTITPIASGGDLVVAIPADLPAGITSVVLTDPITGVSSNPAPFVLRPRIAGPIQINTDSSTHQRHLLLPVVPSVATNQLGAVLLNQVGGNQPVPAAYQIDLARAAAPMATIDVPLPPMTPGVYLVRVQIEGGESRLVSPGIGQPFNGPVVTIP